jgi:hypothetical protein
MNMSITHQRFHAIRYSHPTGQPCHGWRSLWLIALVILITGCATPRAPTAQRSPGEVRAQLVSLIPGSVADRSGWATDIQTAFDHLRLPPSTENLCAVLAVIEQESTYVADPQVPDLARIARDEIDRRAARHSIPRLAVSAALRLKSANGQTYAQRLAAVRTERELSGLYEDMIGTLPLGRRLFGNANPVRTGGPMQVGIAFSERFADSYDYPYADAETIRHEVFSRRGGLYFGIAHLLKYPNSYERHLYRFADFNAGWYASRNAAFQAAVNRAAGTRLALDGDLVLYDAKGGRISATERAVRALAPRLQLDEAAIRRALERGDRFDFEQSELYRRVFELAEHKAGTAPPRAVLPDIDLQSPKITRKLTTAWFATRVQERYQRCVNRAFAALPGR